MSVRIIILLLALPLFLLLAAGAAPAQEFPSRPVRMIAPYAAGGGNDLMARTVAANSYPTWVRWILRPTNSYRGKPTAWVTSRNCMDAVGWVTCIRLAAALTLPLSASARKSLNCRKVMFII